MEIDKEEKLKQYIKDNNKVEKLFYSGLTDTTLEEKFKYIRNHKTYYTMNSWNKLCSIANNVKIYKLNLSKEMIDKFFDVTEIDEDFADNFFSIIKEFEDLTDTNILFNGANAGYIVIVNKNSNNNIIDDELYYYNNYKEYKDKCYYSCSKDYIVEKYYLIKAFDKFCDVLREELISILSSAQIKEEERTFIENVKYVEY